MSLIQIPAPETHTVRTKRGDRPFVIAMEFSSEASFYRACDALVSHYDRQRRQTKAREMADEGMNKTAIARELGITSTTVAAWLAKQ